VRADRAVGDVPGQRGGVGQIPYEAAYLARLEDAQPRVGLVQSVEDLLAQRLGQAYAAELVGGQVGELALSPLVHGCLRLRAPVGTELRDVVPAQAMGMEGGQLAGHGRSRRWATCSTAARISASSTVR
jgi:hypothetical protein